MHDSGRARREVLVALLNGRGLRTKEWSGGSLMQVKHFNRLPEPCADCGARPDKEHKRSCMGGCHSLEAQPEKENDMNLYYGKNASHEFWEDERGDYLIIRHHGHDSWFAINVAGHKVDQGFGTAKRPQTIANRIQRHYGIAFNLNKTRQWVQKRKNARRMKLETVNA